MNHMTGFAPEPRYYTYTSFWRAYPALAWLLIAVVALALLRVAAAAISARRGRKDGRPKLSGYLMLGIVIIGGVAMVSVTIPNMVNAFIAFSAGWHNMRSQSSASALSISASRFTSHSRSSLSVPSSGRRP